MLCSWEEIGREERTLDGGDMPERNPLSTGTVSRTEKVGVTRLERHRSRGLSKERDAEESLGIGDHTSQHLSSVFVSRRFWC